MSDVTKQIAYLERQRKRHQDELPFAQGYAERDDTQFVIDAYSAAIAALSHAAGQDGEQCRAASGVEEIARQMDAMAEHIQASSPVQKAERLRGWVEKLRALSRGVPEGK